MKKHIQFCSLSSGEVYTTLCHASQEGAYISYIRGIRCQTDESLFREVSASFQFPYYFGENWAAFDDCIQDLEWLSFSKIVMVVDDFSSVYKDDAEGKELLLRHLEKMAHYWVAENIDIKILLNN